MSMVASKAGEPARDLSVEWPQALYETLKRARIGHMAYVPDAGHSTLINLFSADADVKTNVLTTEEEGIAIASGAWLGGMRSVVLMQSSGVGNCINMLSLPVQARIPLLMLVTMLVMMHVNLVHQFAFHVLYLYSAYSFNINKYFNSFINTC